MAIFRSSLKQKIVSKTERLSSNMNRGKTLSASDEKRVYLADLRKKTQTTKFVSPSASKIRKKQRMSTEFVRRMVEAFGQFVKRKGIVSVNLANKTKKRFRDSLTNLIERTKERIVGLARRIIDGLITPAEFKDSLTRTIRRLHIASTYLGTMGSGSLTGNITELLVSKISRELNLVGRFTEWLSQIKDSTDELSVSVVDKILRVSGSFVNAARSTFSQTESQLVDDFFNTDEENVAEEMRVLDPGSSQHCDGCLAWSGFWSPIGTLPAVNSLECGTRCRCTKNYRVIQQNQYSTEMVS